MKKPLSGVQKVPKSAVGKSNKERHRKTCGEGTGLSLRELAREQVRGAQLYTQLYRVAHSTGNNEQVLGGAVSF